MTPIEARVDTHEAVCELRYKNIEEKLESGKARMTRIEYLIYIVIAAVLLGPGFASQMVIKFLGL